MMSYRKSVSRKIMFYLFLFITGVLLSFENAIAMDLKDGLYAEFDTDKGTIVVQLYYDLAPLTVTNFVGLAEGTKDSNKPGGTKFYDGLIFHRVISNFMIQGGDPQGTGRGGPGYRFPDEFHTSLRHDSPGILSMANAGPGTNGSQFFITHKATPWLDNKHTVFGKVVKGQDIVDAITKGDKLKHLKIRRIGKDAQAFVADQNRFDSIIKKMLGKKSVQQKKIMAEFEKSMKVKYPNAITTKSGLMYVVEKQGSGPTPERGGMIQVHYTGTFLDGKKFDSSVDRGKPIEFAVGTGRVIKGWDEALLAMKKGEKRKLIIPYFLAYGEKGRPPAIPPRATLLFDVELMDIK